MNIEKARLEELYIKKIRPALKDKLGLKNIMEVPKLSKIVLNVGVKGSVADSKIVQFVSDMLAKIAGQTPVKTLARKSIAGFKLRKGYPIGTKVTLRGKKMYELLDRLINLALPKVRDFRGVSPKFDRRGNYNLGIKEWSIFPEVDFGTENVYGLNITIDTTADKDEHAYELLKEFGMPFRSKAKE